MDERRVWKCHMCNADLRQGGVVEVRGAVTSWTIWQCGILGWSLTDEQRDETGIWHLECSGCGRRIAQRQARAIWRDIAKSWRA
jgi:ribosomal protein L37AE/L43A